MKKLTDEAVAKALGWTMSKATRFVKSYWLTPEGKGHGDRPKPFTTSLDAIVGEIEARKLWWKCGSGIVIGGKKEEAFFANIHGGKSFYAQTAPLALCHALLAYLKENPDEER